MKRAEIFKELKKRNAYKKEYFKMKVPQLKEILEKLDGVKISEPEFGDDDDEEEEEETQPLGSQEITKKLLLNNQENLKTVSLNNQEATVQEPVQEPIIEKQKRIKKEKIQPKQKIVEVPVGIPTVNLEQPKQNYRKDINTIIQNFEENIYDMLKNFDDGELTENDTEIINHEYEQMYDEVSDTIEKLLDTTNVSDSYVSLIQKKLNTISLKVQRFIEMD